MCKTQITRNFSFGTIELIHNRSGGHVPSGDRQLWIDWTQLALPPHHDPVCRKTDHGTRRHRERRHDHLDVCELRV
jgi:hypothetical protein